MFGLHGLHTASLSEAKRIATLASVHGEPYLDQLMLLIEHAQDDEVRRYAYAALIHPPNGNGNGGSH
jgi:hypothetical protein